MLLRTKEVATPRSLQKGRGVFLYPTFQLACLLLLSALVYLPGLKGPFLFDDPPNIIFPLQAWLNGQTSWIDVVFGNASGLLHRPIANASFLANAAISGLAVLPFKLTNLAIHLLCGTLVYALLRKVLNRDVLLHAYAQWAALTVAALWLLHPIQVSTVLYVVQRMAQLSALFTLLALLCFVHGRIALLEARSRRGWLILFLAVPTATLAALLSKENGALVPLLCAVIELAWFAPPVGLKRPNAVRAWFAIFLIIPGILASCWYSWHLSNLENSYNGRLFTLWQRLLSEPRALLDYIGALLYPRGPSLGVYTDDFFPSHGWLDPPSTLPSIATVLLILIVAWSLRKCIPGFFAGIWLYFAGQAMESTIFPLELYFEHRNYLPSIGVFLAVVSLAGWAAQHLIRRSAFPERLRKLLIAATITLLAGLSAASFARARVWGSWPLLATQGAQQHPQSMRAQLDFANLLQLTKQYTAADNIFQHMLSMQSPEARHVGAIDRVALHCMAYGHTSPSDVAHMQAIAGAKLQLGEMLAFENLGNWLQKHPCGQLSKAQLADTIVHIVDAAPQLQQLTQIWRSRFVAAELYVASGNLSRAQTQSALAWMSGAADPSVGVYLASIYLTEGDLRSARLIVNDVRKRIMRWDRRNRELVNQLDTQLHNHSSSNHQ